jgi:hypothetical protein
MLLVKERHFLVSGELLRMDTTRDVAMRNCCRRHKTKKIERKDQKIAGEDEEN